MIDRQRSQYCLMVDLRHKGQNNLGVTLLVGLAHLLTMHALRSGLSDSVGFTPGVQLMFSQSNVYAPLVPNMH